MDDLIFGMDADTYYHRLCRGGMMGGDHLAALSGATPAQIRGWRTLGLLHPEKPDPLFFPLYPNMWLYSWVDYSRARLAVKLSERRVPRRRLPELFERLDAAVPGWYLSLLPPARGRAIVINPDTAQLTVKLYADHPAAPLPCSVNQNCCDAADTELYAAVEILRELQREGSLGQLSHVTDLIVIDPAIQGGAPTVFGHRIETEFVGPPVLTGAQSVEQIAELYRISPEKVRAAVEFERALAA